MDSRDPIVVMIQTFSEAKAVGDAHRNGHVVDLVVRNTDAAVARRVVDFATGMV